MKLQLVGWVYILADHAAIQVNIVTRDLTIKDGQSLIISLNYLLFGLGSVWISDVLLLLLLKLAFISKHRLA